MLRSLRAFRFAPALVCVLAAAPVLAQPSPPAPRPGPMGGPEQRYELNVEQGDFAQAQLARNADSQAEFDRAAAEYQRRQQEVRDIAAQIAADDAAAKSAFAAAQANYEAEKLRREREYAAAMDRWRADVAACKAGDTSHCRT